MKYLFEINWRWVRRREEESRGGGRDDSCGGGATLMKEEEAMVKTIKIGEWWGDLLVKWKGREGKVVEGDNDDDV